MMTQRLLEGMPDGSETSQSPSLEGALAQPWGGGAIPHWARQMQTIDLDLEKCILGNF